MKFLILTLLIGLLQMAAEASVQEQLFNGEKATDTSPLSIEQFSYEISGPPDKPWVILVHGLGGSMYSWQATKKYLQNDFRVLVYDQRGHGESGIDSENYSSSTMAHDLRFLMDALKIENAHLVGHSMGGRTVVRFAEENPLRVLSVTVEDMHMKGRTKLQPDNIALSRMIRPLYRPIFNSDEEFYRTYQPAMRWEKREYIYNFGSTGADGRFYLYFKPHANIIYYTQGLQENLGEALKGVKAPIQFLAAEYDPVLFGAGIDHIRSIKPDAEISTIKGSDHSIHSSAPEAFRTTLTGFIARARAGSCRSIFAK